MLSRAASTLPDATEATVERVIGCAIEVHRHLGAGYLESACHSAMQVELLKEGIRRVIL